MALNNNFTFIQNFSFVPFPWYIEFKCEMYNSKTHFTFHFKSIIIKIIIFTTKALNIVSIFYLIEQLEIKSQGFQQQKWLNLWWFNTPRASESSRSGRWWPDPRLHFSFSFTLPTSEELQDMRWTEKWNKEIRKNLPGWRMGFIKTWKKTDEKHFLAYQGSTLFLTVAFVGANPHSL